MRFLKTFKIIFIVMFVLTSCNSDDEDFQGAGTPPTARRIISYGIRTLGLYEYNSEIDISYDSQKRISNIECLLRNYIYNYDIDYEKMEIIYRITYNGIEYSPLTYKFSMNSQGYITKIWCLYPSSSSEYIYENGYLTKINNDEGGYTEFEYADGNLRKVTEFYVGSYNHIYKEGFWKISYSDDDNISNFNPCFLFENVGEFTHAGGFWLGNGNIGSLCIFFKSVPTATVILSHAGLLGKNSTKLPKKITYYYCCPVNVFNQR